MSQKPLCTFQNLAHVRRISRLILNSAGFIGSIYCNLTGPAKVFYELHWHYICWNLTYVPECLIFLGRAEQWYCVVIGASPVAFENVCPKLLIPSSVWLTIVNQPGWRKRRGLKNIFAIAQCSPKYLIWKNDHKRDHTKWQHGHNSDCASTSLAPLVRAGGSCGLEWTKAPVSSQQREESEVPECK